MATRQVLSSSRVSARGLPVARRERVHLDRVAARDLVLEVGHALPGVEPPLQQPQPLLDRVELRAHLLARLAAGGGSPPPGPPPAFPPRGPPPPGGASARRFSSRSRSWIASSSEPICSPASPACSRGSLSEPSTARV